MCVLILAVLHMFLAVCLYIFFKDCVLGADDDDGTVVRGDH